MLLAKVYKKICDYCLKYKGGSKQKLFLRSGHFNWNQTSDNPLNLQ